MAVMMSWFQVPATPGEPVGGGEQAKPEPLGFQRRARIAT